MKVFLDNNATTPLDPKVKEKMIDFLDFYGNPSGSYEIGRISRQLINESRESVAKLINGNPGNLYFTGSGSESNNMVIKGLFNNQYFADNESHIITSSIEHPSVLEPAQSLINKGFYYDKIHVNAKGIIDIDHFKSLIHNKSKLVSIMLANNEIGTIQPVKEAFSIAKEYGIACHCDISQAVGKIPIDIEEIGADFYTFSAHKLYGPKGVGALYTRKIRKIKPLIEGGQQEKGFRAGTENVLAILGFGIAAQCLNENNDVDKIKFLRDKLEKGIISTIPDTKVNGDPVNRIANTSNISFTHYEGKAILLNLDLSGISVSTGSACKSQSVDASHVLLSLGRSIEEAHSSVRFTLGKFTTEEEIDYVLQVLPGVINRLKKLR